MAATHRKIELQSPADFTYLYANAVALSRQKLDLNFPPLATDDDTPDPMRERVQELVDEVRQTIQFLTLSIDTCFASEDAIEWMVYIVAEPG